MSTVEGLNVDTAALNAGKAHANNPAKFAAESEVEDSQPTETPAVQISLSEEALEVLSDPAEVSGPGKSHQSTAHRARAALELEEFAALRDLPFGKIVSTLAHNGDLSSLLPEPAIDEIAEESEGVETSEPADIATTLGNVTYASQEVSEAELALELLQQSADAEA